MQGLLIRALHETKAMRFALGVMLQLFFEEASIRSLCPLALCAQAFPLSSRREARE